MKKHVVKALKWAVSKLDKPEEVKAEAWPFPVEETPKKKPTVRKATTRLVAKKDTTVAKKATKKAK